MAQLRRSMHSMIDGNSPGWNTWTACAAHAQSSCSGSCSASHLMNQELVSALRRWQDDCGAALQLRRAITRMMRKVSMAMETWALLLKSAAAHAQTEGPCETGRS